MKISLNSRISKSEKLAQRVFEEQMLVITAKDSILHRFNEVGTFIWQILEQPLTVENILNKIGDNFDDFDQKKSEREIIQFLEDLENKGLIKTG